MHLDCRALCVGQPKRAWLRELLQLLARFGNLKALESWPLLPVEGSRLRALHPESQVCLVVSRALELLTMAAGCCRMDLQRGRRL